jgi:hypothetical protein
MALTRLEVEKTLYTRVAPAMARADMDVTAEGENRFYGDAITFSLMEWNYTTPSKFTDPSDADIAQVQNTDLQKFLGVCEWRIVATIIGNLDDTDEKLGPTGMWNSQYAKQMERLLDRIENRLMNEYGWGPTTLSTGTMEIISIQRDQA